ncbi:MAG: hypothetical protein KF762_04955 [Acidobacteria bacterium]|nr:hypothetical protein [Acidobacteriota bacterium]
MNESDGKLQFWFLTLSVVTVLVGAVLSDAILLFKTDVAVGIDGYFYAQQVSSFLVHGKLYYPTYSTALTYFFSIFAHIFSDVVFAIKAGTLILQCALCIGIFNLVSTVTKNRWHGLLGLSIAAFSNLHLYYVSEFLNNLGALVCLAWGAFAITKFRENGKRLWLIISLSLIAGAILAHRSALLVIPIIILSLVLSKFLISPRNNFERIAAISFGLIIFVIPAIVLFQPIFEIPSMLRTELLAYPLLPSRELNFPETIMLVVSVAVGVITLRLRGLEGNRETAIVLFSVLIWSLFTTLNPFLNHRSGVQGVFGRLDTLAFIQASVAAPLALRLLQEKTIFFRSLAASCFVGLLIWSFCKPIPFGISDEYIARRERLINELPKIPKPPCQDPFVIARHGDQFLVTYVLGLPSQQTFPEAFSNKCVYWLIDVAMLELQFSDPRFLRNGSDFALVESSLVQEFTGGLSDSEKRLLVARNPHLELFIGTFTNLEKKS